MSLTRSHPSSWPRLVLLMVAAAMLVACGPSPSPSRTEPAGSQPQRAGGQNSITIAVSDTVEAMSIMGSSTTSGGWQSVNELHSQGLVTADRDVQRPFPRLATELPSLDRGTIELLPDGRMKSVYPLRRDVTWQDGTRSRRRTWRSHSR